MRKDEPLYDQVAEDLSRGQIRRGLWTKALADTGYDEQKAKAAYIRMRVEDLRSEASASARFCGRQALPTHHRHVEPAAVCQS